MHDASREFFELMNGTPCVHKGAVLKQHEHEVSVESTDIYVRICPRAVRDANGEWVALRVEESRARQDAFHAFLVGNSARQQEILAYSRDHSVHGLPPEDPEAAPMCLHTCAVQCTAFHLGERVTLYATHSRGGRAPGGQHGSVGLRLRCPCT